MEGNSNILIYIISKCEDGARSWSLEEYGFRTIALRTIDEFFNTYDASIFSCLISDDQFIINNAINIQDMLANARKSLDSFKTPVIFLAKDVYFCDVSYIMNRGRSYFLNSDIDTDYLVSIIKELVGLSIADWEIDCMKARCQRLILNLTSSEKRVLDCMVLGNLNKQIAEELGISIKTVEAHRSNVMTKMGTKSIAEIVQMVLGQRIYKSDSVN